MKSFHPLKSRLRTGLGLAVIVAAVNVVSIGLLMGADTKSSDTKPAAPEKTAPEKKTPRKLTGAELYAINCSRCHAERYPTEFNSAHWQTLMTHMRVRANLPAKQAREILKYLQEESGN